MGDQQTQRCESSAPTKKRGCGPRQTTASETEAEGRFRAMVSPQATQPAQPPHPRPTDWQAESARITAEDVPPEVRRQILHDHYADRLITQRPVVESERQDRRSNPDKTPLYSFADMRVSNTIAVLQDIASALAGYSDNRDFGQVAR